MTSKQPNIKTYATPVLLDNICQVINQAQSRVKHAVNSTMVQAYWHIGQFYEEQQHRPDDNSTIGLTLCSEHNHNVAKYSVLNESKQLFGSKYLTQLPSEEKQQRELEKERARVQKQFNSQQKALDDETE